MQTTHKNLFTTIRTEGGILPADLLQRVASGDRDIDGLTPEAYHLAGNEKLNEAINRSWNHLLGVWETFKTRVAPVTDSESGSARAGTESESSMSAGIIPAEGVRGARSHPRSEALTGPHPRALAPTALPGTRFWSASAVQSGSD